MPSALVTGATGLVGSHIVDELLAAGWRVRALVRSQAPALAARDVEIVQGDVLEATAFVRAATNCDVIFHNAAVISAAGGWEVYQRQNIDGTRAAIEAAERSGARLVQLSSVAVYGGRYDEPGRRVDEETPFRPLPPRAHYARSKRESEALVFEAHAAGRIQATAVRPCVIYGPRDRQFVPRIARILQFGFAPLIQGGWSTLAIVQAANVAAGTVLAATSSVSPGRAYNLANDFDVSVREFFTLAGRGLGRRVRLVPVAEPAARAVFAAALGVTRLLHGDRASVVASGSVDMVTRDNPFTSDRARLELGWTPRVRPEKGVPAAFRWWREHCGGGS